MRSCADWDVCDGQAEENGDHADDIHIGQDPDPAALCVFLAEGFGEPAVVTGGPYGDGIIGKAGVEGGQQRHDGAADNEEVEQDGGEQVLRRYHQSGGQFGFQSANAVIFFIVIVVISVMQLTITGKKEEQL